MLHLSQLSSQNHVGIRNRVNQRVCIKTSGTVTQSRSSTVRRFFAPAPVRLHTIPGFGHAVVDCWGEHQHHLSIHERIAGWPRVCLGRIRLKLLHRARTATRRPLSVKSQACSAVLRVTVVLGCRYRCAWVLLTLCLAEISHLADQNIQAAGVRCICH